MATQIAHDSHWIVLANDRIINHIRFVFEVVVVRWYLGVENELHGRDDDLLGQLVPRTQALSITDANVMEIDLLIVDER